MSSTNFGFRIGSAVFAMGVGVAVASNPGIAVADSPDSGSASHAPTSSKSTQTSDTTDSTRSAPRAVGSSRRAAQQSHVAADPQKKSTGRASATRPSAADPSGSRATTPDEAPSAAKPASTQRVNPGVPDTATAPSPATEQDLPTTAVVPSATVPTALVAPARHAVTAAARPGNIVSGFLSLFGLTPGTGLPPSPIQLLTGALALFRRDLDSVVNQVSAWTSAATARSLSAAATGSTTRITWAWGSKAVVAFNPATDKLDFGWMQSNQFTVVERSGSVVIGVVDNNHSYTLQGVSLGQLSMTNIVAKDAGTVAKWQSLISGAQTALPSVSIADTTVTEGNSGTTNAAFAITLSKASTKPVTVNYTTANGSATAGQDYTASSGTVTFAAGQVSQVVDVGVLGDTAVEPAETFTVTLSNASGATISDASATGTITNDDTATTPGGDTGTTAQWGKSFFAPYVDMGAWPVPNLLALSKTYGTSLVTLGFMQADQNGNLAWAGLAALEPSSTNDQAVAINTSIATFKAAGGDVMISFGGASGTNIAQAYAAKGKSAQELANAYAAVIDTYGVTHIDFDIEGAAVADPASIALNSQALALLQKQKPEVHIWYTLPVLPTGLTADGLNVVDAAVKAGVKLDGVNVMAMDYGESAAPTSGAGAKTMGAYAIQSAQSTYAQLTTLYGKYGQSFSYSQIGVTPMLGVNDVTTEVFTVADAQALEDFARANGIGMLSMWQVLRDTPGTLGQASTGASGLSDPQGSFSNVFNDYGTINVVDYGSTGGAGSTGGTGGGGGTGTPVTGGTTTTITWGWGTNPLLTFNPAKDTLDFVWMQPSEFDVTEKSGSVVISVVGNNHTYTLQGVTLSQLQIGNIIAKDTGTLAKWQSLIDSAKAV